MSHRRTHWRSFYLCLCAIALAGAVMVLVVPRLAGLFLLGLYCIPTNSIFPLPHEPGVLYFAQFYDPLWIAIAATVASVVMSFADYAMVEAWMRHPRLGAVQHSRLFKWAVRWMKRWPFAIIVLFSLTPLPISVVRILAPASGYPVSRYIAAQIVGRLPRFYALAWLGAAIQFPTWALVAIFVATVGLFWLSTRSQADADEGDEEEMIDPPTATV
jgi:membrane protein YqaA with SNARE-associated domain